jgi:histidyl-tRNA synthetase
VRTQVYTEQKKVKAKFSYADKLSIPYAVIIGGDEAENHTVSLKNLKTGDQVTLSAQEAAATILENINHPVKPVKGS